MISALERLRPLFHPRGIIVTGVSTHPGKFGTAAYHNLLRFNFAGELFPINREGAEVLGRPVLRSIEEVPEGKADLVFVCTPAGVNPEILEACSRRGVRAAFIASAGYGEAGEKGRRMERELVRLADGLGMVVAGPNGQGVISTSVSMCAQIVAPYPPPGAISMVSQSGNIGSSFMNYGCLFGVGFSKLSCRRTIRMNRLIANLRSRRCGSRSFAGESCQFFCVGLKVLFSSETFSSASGLYSSRIINGIPDITVGVDGRFSANRGAIIMRCS